MPTRHFHQKLLKVLRCYSRHLTIYILNHYTKYMRLKYFQLGSKHRIIKKKCNVSLQCRLFFLFFSYFIFFKMKNVQIFKKQTSLFSMSTPFKLTPIPSLCYFSIYMKIIIFISVAFILSKNFSSLCSNIFQSFTLSTVYVSP